MDQVKKDPVQSDNPPHTRTHTKMVLSPVALVTGAVRASVVQLLFAWPQMGLTLLSTAGITLSQASESLAEEISAQGRRVYIAIADVSSDEQVRTMVEIVVKELGSLDVVSSVHPWSRATSGIDVVGQMVANAAKFGSWNTIVGSR